MRESEGSEYEMERTTTQKIMSVVVTITEKIKTEVFSAKGEMVRRAESSVSKKRSHLCKDKKRHNQILKYQNTSMSLVISE